MLLCKLARLIEVGEAKDKTRHFSSARRRPCPPGALTPRKNDRNIYIYIYTNAYLLLSEGGREDMRLYLRSTPFPSLAPMDFIEKPSAGIVHTYKLNVVLLGN